MSGNSTDSINCYFDMLWVFEGGWGGGGGARKSGIMLPTAYIHKIFYHWVISVQ